MSIYVTRQGIVRILGMSSSERFCCGFDCPHLHTPNYGFKGRCTLFNDDLHGSVDKRYKLSRSVLCLQTTKDI